VRRKRQPPALERDREQSRVTGQAPDGTRPAVRRLRDARPLVMEIGHRRVEHALAK
jgi:hypothetical protein